MAQTRTHHAEHRITVAAPPGDVYAFVADVSRWPRVFPPTVHAERVDGDGGDERIRLWATANDTVKTWTSRRRLDPSAHTVTFRQEVSQPPVAAMGGTWRLTDAPGGGTLVVLEHDFQAVGDDAAGVSWITHAVDRNSDAELAALKAAAESAATDGELLLSFADTERVSGAAEDVYAFLRDAARWPDRLPHVSALTLQEEDGIQRMEMVTRTADGGEHATYSVRVCLPPGRIVYKQLRTPALMRVHTGEWTVRDLGGDECEVISAHVVVLEPANVTTILGPDATIAMARDFVRRALGRNSTATMRHAKAYAEGCAAHV